MKRRLRREYAPRRGMRFRRDVGGSATPTIHGTLNRSSGPEGDSDQRSLVISGSVQRFVTGPEGDYLDPASRVVTSSSIYLEGSITIGRSYARQKMNAQLLGSRTSDVRRPPWPSTTVMENPTPAGDIQNGRFVPPSWTHASVGFNQAFVGMALTSSFLETKTLNCFLSGTQALEQSANPVSGNLFYSKASRLRTIVVKHTGSFFDTVAGATGTVPAAFAAGTGVNCSTVTGTNFPSGLVNSLNNPATILIDVPVSGRLVDIKVWLEVVHLSGSPGRYRPLSILGASLRSPNLSWGNAHPLYNDPIFKAQAQSDTWPIPIPTFYRDSFLLWEGPAHGPFSSPEFPGAEPATGDLVGGFDTRKYPCWGKDRSMRTVFSDGASTPNPRRLYAASPSGNYLGAPNAYNGTSSANTPSPDGLNINSAFGCNIPWTSDATVFPATETFQRVGSPPKGWLNGGGGSAAVNEWPTTGFNYGAESLQPVYPLLDEIFIRKSIGTERSYDGGSLPVPAPTPDAWRGFRPGLRGTEISGTWRLMLVSNLLGGATTDACDLYFRQARLEITYETPGWTAPGRIRASTSRNVERANQEKFLYAISGSDDSNAGTIAGSNYDWFRTLIYTRSQSDSEIGRTLGIALNSGSTDDRTDYALLYRLTGTLSSLSGSSPAWLLNNQFRVPMIPLSSASLSPRIPEEVEVRSFATAAQTRVLDGARRLRDVAQDLNAPKSVVEIAAEFTSGSSI